MNYQRKDYFELFEEQLGEFHLMQLVKVDTWSRLVGSELRSSLLNHIYVYSVNLVKNVTNQIMNFGDPSLVMVDLGIGRPFQKQSIILHCKDERTE